MRLETHMQAPVPPRLDGPCVPIHQPETNHFLMRLENTHASPHPASPRWSVRSHPAGRETIRSCTDTCAMSTHQMRSTPWQTNPSESRHRKPRVGVHGRQRKQLRASPSKTFNFARNQARWRGGSKQWRREPGAGSRCEKKTPGEADLQDDARLVARLVVKMQMRSCR